MKITDKTYNILIRESCDSDYKMTAIAGKVTEITPFGYSAPVKVIIRQGDEKKNL